LENRPREKRQGPLQGKKQTRYNRGRLPSHEKKRSMSIFWLSQLSHKRQIVPWGANPAFYLGGPSAVYSQFSSMAPYVDQPISYMPPLKQFQYSLWDPHMGMCVQYSPISMPSFHPGWGALQRSVFDRFRVSVHAQLGPSQSSLEVRVGQHTYRSGELVRLVEQ
jgi:hypothetical protein